MRLQEKLREERLALFEELSRYREEPVIVEGRKDVEALGEIGFTRIIPINKGRGLYDVSVDIKLINGDRTVLVLTDYDPEGERLAKRMGEYLRSIGCHVDEPGRERLRKLFYRNKLTTVQGLRNLERD